MPIPGCTLGDQCPLTVVSNSTGQVAAAAIEKDKSESVVGDVGIAILALLLALIMQGMLDALLVNKAAYTDWDVFWQYTTKYPQMSVLITFQVIVLVSIVIRFYMGTFRLHKCTVKEPKKRSFFTGVISTLVLFSLFYVAAVLVKNVHLFYIALFAQEAASVLFSSAIMLLVQSQSLKAVWQRFLAFDIVSAIALGFVTFQTFWFIPPLRDPTDTSDYPMKKLVLGVLFLIGIIDVGSCWHFYADKRDSWEKWRTVGQWNSERIEKRKKKRQEEQRLAEEAQRLAEAKNKALKPTGEPSSTQAAKPKNNQPRSL
jgi:hypothetical protein